MIKKIKHTFIYNIIDKYIKLSDNNFVFISFLISPFIFFLIKFGGFKFFFIYYLFLTILIIYKLKKVLTPLILTYLFTLQFLNPAKSYPVLVISIFKEVVLDFKTGYLKDFALNTSNIFLILVIIISLRTMLVNKFKLNFRDYRFSFSIIFLIIFLLVGFASSFNRSPFFTASMIWLLQYSQVFLAGIIIYCVFKYMKKDFQLVMYTFLATVVFQSIISLVQFVRQSSLGLIFERDTLLQWSVSDMDLIGNIYRVFGTFSHPNELGLIMVLLLCLILPYILYRKSGLFILSVILCWITVLLTQSRSAWLGLFMVFVIFIKFYYKKIKRYMIKILSNKRIITYSLIVFVLLSYIIIPRILLSSNIFYRSGALDIRMRMLRESWEAIKLSPFLGYGVGTNEVVLYELSPRGFMKEFPSSVHTGFVQLILEVGFLGFMVFILPFVIMFYLIIRKLYFKSYDMEYKKFFFGYLAGFLTFVLYFLFQPHWGQYDFAYLGLIYGVGLISTVVYEKKKNKIL